MSNRVKWLTKVMLSYIWRAKSVRRLSTRVSVEENENIVSLDVSNRDSSEVKIFALHNIVVLVLLYNGSAHGIQWRHNEAMSSCKSVR